MKADASQSLGQANALTQSFLDSMVRYNEIVADRVDQWLKLTQEVVNEELERNLQFLRDLGAVKQPQDAITNQLNYFSETRKRNLDNARRYVALAVEANAHINNAFQQRTEQQSKAGTGPQKAA